MASGDLDFSNRIQPDDTLIFEDEDHSYGGPDSKGLPGDPLAVIRDFAKQIAAKGIKRIKGRVLVDASLFPEGYRELGTGVVVSPIVVNDNVIDVIISPGATENSPVQLKIAPQTAYVTIINQATTGKAGSKPTVDYGEDKAESRWLANGNSHRQFSCRRKAADGVFRCPGAEPLCRDSARWKR